MDWISMPRGAPRTRSINGLLNIVGPRVLARRKELKLTRDGLCARLAAASGGRWVANEPDIYKLEKGLRSVHDVEVILLAEALECTTSWLLS